jgi:hypothetical protein
MLALAPVAKYLASNQVPEVMYFWALLGVWAYVLLALCVFFTARKVLGEKKPRIGSNKQFQQTPNGAAGQ